MKKYNLLILFIISVFSIESWAMDRSSRGVEVHLYGGYTAFDSYGLAEIENAFSWTLKGSYDLPWGVQLGVAYNQARAESILGSDATLRSFRFEPLYLILDRDFTPYVKATVGYQWAAIDQIDTSAGFLYGAGTGFRSVWNEIFSTWVGIDLTRVSMGAPVDASQTNWNIYLGSSLSFGPYKNYSHAKKKKQRSSKVTKSGLIEPQVCKNVPKGVPVDEHGCPLDFDGDRIPDYTDLCPGTKTTKVDQMGCPLDHFARGIVRDISFEAGSAQLTSGSYKHLKKIAGALKRFSGLHYVIEGHTDSTGQADENLTLSNARAQTVVNALVQYGVPKENISPIGYGQQYPVAPNNNKQGRDLNRRVEIKWQNQ